MYSCMVEESETMGTNNMIFWDCLSYFKNMLDHCIVHHHHHNNNTGVCQGDKITNFWWKPAGTLYNGEVEKKNSWVISRINGKALP